MLSKDSQFRRLKIRGGGLIGTASYWLGPDHLLIVTVDGYTERYRRIFFRDIQAIVIRRTTTWIWLTVALSALSLVGAVLPASTGAFEGMIVGSLILAGFGGGLIFNLIAGPTCTCRVITAVQNRDLPHLNRWKSANRLLEALQVEVNQVQRPISEAPASETPVGESTVQPTVEPVLPATDQSTV